MIFFDILNYMRILYIEKIIIFSKPQKIVKNNYNLKSNYLWLSYHSLYLPINLNSHLLLIEGWLEWSIYLRTIFVQVIQSFFETLSTTIYWLHCMHWIIHLCVFLNVQLLEFTILWHHVFNLTKWTGNPSPVAKDFISLFAYSEFNCVVVKGTESVDVSVWSSKGKQSNFMGKLLN